MIKFKEFHSCVLCCQLGCRAVINSRRSITYHEAFSLTDSRLDKCEKTVTVTYSGRVGFHVGYPISDENKILARCLQLLCYYLFSTGVAVITSNTTGTHHSLTSAPTPQNSASSSRPSSLSSVESTSKHTTSALCHTNLHSSTVDMLRFSSKAVLTNLGCFDEEVVNLWDSNNTRTTSWISNVGICVECPFASKDLSSFAQIAYRSRLHLAIDRKCEFPGDMYDGKSSITPEVFGKYNILTNNLHTKPVHNKTTRTVVMLLIKPDWNVIQGVVISVREVRVLSLVVDLLTWFNHWITLSKLVIAKTEVPNDFDSLVKFVNEFAAPVDKVPEMAAMSEDGHETANVVDDKDKEVKQTKDNDKLLRTEKKTVEKLISKVNASANVFPSTNDTASSEFDPCKYYVYKQETSKDFSGQSFIQFGEEDSAKVITEVIEIVNGRRQAAHTDDQEHACTKFGISPALVTMSGGQIRDMKFYKSESETNKTKKKRKHSDLNEHKKGKAYKAVNVQQRTEKSSKQKKNKKLKKK
ncbi:hypothetical protein MAR_010775 [Mya arenaria]|uniref:Uncharacterized protein n=1 Tax=Mya arenaria TaxID=6604 RepID=A0ABY7FWF7_MYAAR|nr:hypothetical protein MAR_010775 [Mya arenaria]